MNHSQNIPILKKKITNLQIQKFNKPKIQKQRKLHQGVHHNQIALLKTDDKKKILKAAGEKGTNI